MIGSQIETRAAVRSKSAPAKRRSPLARAGIVTLILAATAGLSLLASACGGSSSSGVASVDATTTSTAPRAHGSAIAFARCMRRHGTNVPDDLTDTPAHPWGDEASVHAALQACRRLIPPGLGQPAHPSAQVLKQLLAYAVCMRAHGIEISDPDPATGDMQLSGYTRARMQTDPVFKAAETACQDKRPGRWQRKGPG